MPSSLPDPALTAAAVEEAPPPAIALESLPLHLIRPNPNQPRKYFPSRELAELIDSIRTVGLVQPIVVRPAVAGSYTIVAGERRYRAFQVLAAENPRFGTIPAVVAPRGDAEMQVAALVENIVRDDLNPIERAEALHSLKTELQTNWEGVAKRVGMSVRHVHFLTGMLKLRKDFKDAVATGQMTEKHTRALRKLGPEQPAAYDLFEYLTRHPHVTGDQAMDLATVMAKHAGVSAEEAAALLQEPAAKVKGAKPKAKPAKATQAEGTDVARLAKQLSEALRREAEALDPSVLLALQEARAAIDAALPMVEVVAGAEVMVGAEAVVGAGADGPDTAKVEMVLEEPV